MDVPSAEAPASAVMTGVFAMVSGMGVWVVWLVGPAPPGPSPQPSPAERERGLLVADAGVSAMDEGVGLGAVVWMVGAVREPRRASPASVASLPRVPLRFAKGRVVVAGMG